MELTSVYYARIILLIARIAGHADPNVTLRVLRSTGT
jgi:hypothetical protein